MELDVWKPSILQNPLVEGGNGVGVIHLPGERGGEQIGVLRVFFVLLNEQVDGLLGDGHLKNLNLRFSYGIILKNSLTN